MSVDLVVKNARLVDANIDRMGAVAVSNGRLVAVGEADTMPQARRVIDAGGRCLMSGLIDPHCHLGVAFPFEEDMRTETAQAARGGITSIFLYIRNKAGPYVPFYQERRAQAERNVLIDFGFHFGIQREEHIHEIPEIIEKTGVRSFKLYFGYEPDNPIGIVPATDGWVYATMRQLANVPGAVVSVHCENTAIASFLKHEMIASGRQDLGAYTESRPSFCEVETIRRMIFLARQTGCTLHLVHTSVGAGPDLAAEARASGMDVTVETCPHYLTRTCYDADLDMRAKISPPLREAEQKEWLWRGIANGRVDQLGSDHVPFLPKKGEDLWTEFPGVVSFPWELPLLVTQGYHERGISLSRISQINSRGPAVRFGHGHRKGLIEPGMDADFVILDLDEERTVRHVGKGHCIYEGMKLKGWAATTVSRGRVVMEEGAIDEAAFGSGQCLTVPGGA